MQYKGKQVEKVDIILLNMGGPKTLEEIPNFLKNLFADKDLIQIPFPINAIQPLIAWIISKSRTNYTTEMYRMIGGGSPIYEITKTFGSELEEELRLKNLNADVSIEMRYSYPRARDVVPHLNGDQIVLFSQYPHYADSTSGSSFRELIREYNRSGGKGRILEIKDWSTADFYVNWWVEEIKKKLFELEETGIRLTKKTHVIFTSHGLPQSYIDRGERYTERIDESRNKIIEKLGTLAEKISFHQSYQSRAGPFPWIRPYTDELLEQLAEDRSDAVIMVPLGFVTDHVETLYEIDILYRDLAEELGIDNYHRVAVPNSDQDYVKGAAEFIIKTLEKLQ